MTLSARLTNGEPLPAWISFDSRNAVFTIDNSAQPRTSEHLRLTAADQHGLESSTVFRVHAAGVQSVDLARASLTDRLTAAARQNQSTGVQPGIQLSTASVQGN